MEMNSPLGIMNRGQKNRQMNYIKSTLKFAPRPTQPIKCYSADQNSPAQRGEKIGKMQADLTPKSYPSTWDHCWSHPTNTPAPHTGQPSRTLDVMIQRPCPQPPLWPEALLWVPEANSLLDKTTWISNRLIKLNSSQTELQTNPTHHLAVPTSLLESANINPIHLVAQGELPAVHLSVDPSLSWMPQFNPQQILLVLSSLISSPLSAHPGFLDFAHFQLKIYMLYSCNSGKVFLPGTLVEYDLLGVCNFNPGAWWSAWQERCKSRREVKWPLGTSRYQEAMELDNAVSSEGQEISPPSCVLVNSRLQSISSPCDFSMRFICEMKHTDACLFTQEKVRPRPSHSCLIND